MVADGEQASSRMTGMTGYSRVINDNLGTDGEDFKYLDDEDEDVKRRKR